MALSLVANAQDIGWACLLLGGSRGKAGDTIDWGVEMAEIAKMGEKVRAGNILAGLYASSKKSLATRKNFSLGLSWQKVRNRKRLF